MARILDTNLLRTFVTITDCGGFGRASERLNFAQPTVSLHIKRLEDQLGKKLFRRDGRNMVVTEDGYRLLRYARRILALNEEAWSSVGPSGVTGEVQLGIIQDLNDDLLSDLFGNFSHHYPNVLLNVIVANTMELEAYIDSGKIDIAIMAGQASSQATLFAREAMVWIGSERLDVDLQDAVPLVLCSPPCGLRELAISLLEANQLAWRLAFTSPSLAGVKAAVRAGLGVTLRATSALEPGLIRLGETSGLPALPAFEVIVIRSPRCEGAPAINALEDLVATFATRSS